MNGLSNLDETYREYSLAPIDDPIRFWRSEVKVTTGRRRAKGSLDASMVVEIHCLVAVYVLFSHN